MALNLDAIGKKIGPVSKEYNWKDLVLYALGVGAGFDELEYCYEHQLKVIPSFSIASVFEFLAEVGMSSNADLSGILHGEQDIIFHNPIPTEGRLTTEGVITNMYDKGSDKGALVVAEADTYHSDGSKLFTNIFTIFCRKRIRRSKKRTSITRRPIRSVPSAVSRSSSSWGNSADSMHAAAIPTAATLRPWRGRSRISPRRTRYAKYVGNRCRLRWASTASFSAVRAIPSAKTSSRSRVR